MALFLARNLTTFIQMIHSMYKLFVAILVFCCLQACNVNDRPHPRDGFETGRIFIRASLDGDFLTAEKLLYRDTLNQELFDAYKTMYNRLPQDKKDKYKNSNFDVINVNDDADSVIIIKYANSYMKRPQEIKVIKNNGDWWIDFKYISADSVSTK